MQKLIAATLAFVALMPTACGGGGGGLRGRDRASAVGIAETSQSWSAPVGDIDGDGRQDFIYNHHFSAPDIIYRNTGGRFVPYAPGTLVAKDRHHCAIGDVDRDGLPDIFCSIGGHKGTGRKANELWIQQRNHTFVDKAAAYGVVDPTGRGRYAALIDVNGDGYLDLFQGNETPRADGTPVPNHLYLNDRGRRFRPTPKAGLDVADGNVCLQVVDFDRDGDPDVLSCGNFGVSLYRNDGKGHFTDITKSSGLLPIPPGTDQTPPTITEHRPYWRYARLADLDGDGKLDAIGLTRDGLFAQRARLGSFAAPVKIRSLKFGFQVEVGDINADGKPDLYVVRNCDAQDRDAPDLMLLNTGSIRSFKEVPMDEAKKGCGWSVDPIDYNGDRRTDFIVTNGRTTHRGPIQLIDFAPAA